MVNPKEGSSAGEGEAGPVWLARKRLIVEAPQGHLCFTSALREAVKLCI
jgi:hypothetical protein